jgi:hypothetical protein
MDDPDDPYSPDDLSWNWSSGRKWRPFSSRGGRGLRVPPPPGPPPRPSKAQREQEGAPKREQSGCTWLA